MNALLALWQQDPAFVVCLLFLTWLGYVWPFEIASRNLFVPYLAGFALYLSYSLIGLDAIAIMLAPLVPGLLPWRLELSSDRYPRPRVIREDRAQWLRRTHQILIDVVGLGTACVLHSGLVSLLGILQPPFPISDPDSLGRYLLFVTLLLVLFNLCAAGFERLVAGRGPFAGMSGSGEPRKYSLANEIFGVFLIAAGPLQYTVYFLYQVRGDGMTPLFIAIAWTLMMNFAFNVWGIRGINLVESRRELELARRLARVGSDSARIVHRVRHEVALIGIGINRLEKQLASLDSGQAARLREEIARLEATRDNLQAACAIGSAGESAGSEPEPEAALLTTVLGRQCRLLENKALERRVRLRLLRSPTALRRLRDPALVGEALFNVIENAVTAARSSVQVSLANDGDALLVTVQDDGPGMAPDVMKRAFDPFFTTKPDGSGMGLAIARGAIEQEGGTIALDNAQPGLRVSIRLPSSVAG